MNNLINSDKKVVFGKNMAKEFFKTDGNHIYHNGYIKYEDYDSSLSYPVGTKFLDDDGKLYKIETDGTLTQSGTIGGTPTPTSIDVAGILRQDAAGSGWYFINDQYHKPENVDTVTVNADGKLVVAYSVTGNGIRSVGAEVDESFDSLGVRAGVSAGNSQSIITFRKDLSLNVANVSLAVSHDPYFGNKITATANADGTITVNHPPMGNASQAPVIGAGGVVGSPTYTMAVTDWDHEHFTYGCYGPTSGYIYYDGSDWIVMSKDKQQPTVTFDNTTGKLTVTHASVNSEGVQLSDRLDSAGYHMDVQFDNLSSTSFDVYFVDRNDTTSIYSNPNTSMRFSYLRSGLVLKEPVGYAKVHRENLFVHADDLYGGSANVWFNARLKA